MSDKSKTGMVSLINYLGDEKIKFQIVHNSIDGQVKLIDKGAGTRFTMATESTNLHPGDFLPKSKPRKIGLLLWVDPDDFEAWRKATS